MIKFFRPEQVLGLGAFSIVIKAYDILSHKNVAIKILEKALHNAMCLEILKKEAEILDQLNHPNIPRFYMVSAYARNPLGKGESVQGVLGAGTVGGEDPGERTSGEGAGGEAV